MVTIRLVGEAGRRFGRKFQLAIKTPAEGLRALMLQIPGLREYLLESGDKGVAWKVITDHSPEGIDEEQLLWPISKRLVLAPVPVGRGGVGKVVAGVALVAFAILVPGLGATAATIFGTPFGAVSLGIGAIGASMLFGGVADLLTPTPKMPTVKGGVGRSSATTGRSQAEQLNSFTFDKSNANTVQGDVVPVLYGERIIGALPVLSFGLELQNFL
jgi:predicted phage tail protein|tara:strand:- start:768 stop:1412 length:645 start_codon:yes stop_codon:yes gene_type:complete